MNIALCGLGKAGTEFIRYMNALGSNAPDTLIAALCRDSSPTAGKSIAEATGVVTSGDLHVQKIHDYLRNAKPDNVADAVIDFSASSTTFELLDLCLALEMNLVICPTDFSSRQIDQIRKKAETGNIGVMYAPTLTPGVNVLMNFVEQFSKNFPDYHFVIEEKHPRAKSAPSKTATYIANAIARDDVPLNSIRLDGYTGIHEVTATDGFERLTITHESFSRSAFARGALKAARFLEGKKGFFSINEVYKRSLLS